jgi:BlaI family penicillinase repressor
MAMHFVPPAEFELQILTVLWDHGPATVRQVMERLDDGKERAYTSVLSVIQVMQKKGLISAEKPREGLAYVYSAKVKRDQIVGPMLRGFVDKVFGGSHRMAVQQLLNEGDIQAGEIDELRRFLDDLESRGKNGGPHE